MITDEFIIRKADNILFKNEIAIFHPMYFQPSENISAISIENTKISVLPEEPRFLICISVLSPYFKVFFDKDTSGLSGMEYLQFAIE